MRLPKVAILRHGDVWEHGTQRGWIFGIDLCADTVTLASSGSTATTRIQYREVPIHDLLLKWTLTEPNYGGSGYRLVRHDLPAHPMVQA